MTTSPGPRQRLTSAERAAEYQARRTARIRALVDAAPPITGGALVTLTGWATHTRRQMTADGTGPRPQPCPNPPGPPRPRPRGER